MDVINSLKDTKRMSPDAAKSYENAAGRLVKRVNDELEANPRIPELIGRNPFHIMRKNNSNHATLMITVLNKGSLELLARTIPWMYRAYHARGFSYDYFPVEFSAWKHAIAECIDNVYSAEIIEIYDWMIRQHENMIQLSVSADELVLSPRSETTEMQEVLLSLLLQGDSSTSLQLANQSVQTIDDLKHFYLDVVCPVMCRIGLLWERDEISVAEEHLATAIIGRIAASFYPRFANLDIYRGKVVVTAGPNEFHELGARMVADFLEMEGWDVTYLGVNIPKEALLVILKQHKPFIVALSVATVFNLDHARLAIEMIREDQETKGIKILVGGFAFNGMTQLWNDLGADGYAADADKGVLSANEWWEKRII